jgi:hypothetical protein
MNSAEVRVELGARGDAPWVLNSPAVAAAFHDDTMKSVKCDVEALLRGPASTREGMAAGAGLGRARHVPGCPPRRVAEKN